MMVTCSPKEGLMLETIRRQFPLVLFIAVLLLVWLFMPKHVGAQAPADLYLPQVIGSKVNTQNQQPMTQVRFGNGLMRNMNVGSPSGCIDGNYTDLVAANEAIVVMGYSFHLYATALLPTIIEVNEVDQSYLVSFGQELDYLLFDSTPHGIVASRWTNFSNSEPFDISQPVKYLGWDIVLEENVVTLSQGDSKVWITAEGEYFCTEVQTPVNDEDVGIFKSFITKKNDLRLNDYVYNRWTIE